MSAYADHFGLQNIPYGIASCQENSLPPQCVTRLHDTVIFLTSFARAHFFGDTSKELEEVFRAPSLNQFAALPRSTQLIVRKSLQDILQGDHSKFPSGSAINISKVTLHLPVEIGDYTDFSASKEHLLNCGEAIWDKRELPPSFLSFPIGYGGRCSSIAVSGTDVERPLGQSFDGQTVRFGECRAFDYELEMAAVIGKPVPRGGRPLAKDADEHIFGLVLLNDWSARDIQAFEMNPLGPFNSKNTLTSISPWIITLEALESARVPAPPRDKPVAAYLADSSPKSSYSIELRVDLISSAGTKATKCQSNLKLMYWTFRQMLAHHTIGGCSMRAGDLIASGTASGNGIGAHGCLLESSRKGATADAMLEHYLKDGDTVVLSGKAGEGVGFGECVGTVRPARALEVAES